MHVTFTRTQFPGACTYPTLPTHSIPLVHTDVHTHTLVRTCRRQTQACTLACTRGPAHPRCQSVGTQPGAARNSALQGPRRLAPSAVPGARPDHSRGAWRVQPYAPWGRDGPGRACGSGVRPAGRERDLPGGSAPGPGTAEILARPRLWTGPAHWWPCPRPLPDSPGSLIGPAASWPRPHLSPSFHLFLLFDHAPSPALPPDWPYLAWAPPPYRFLP